MANWKTYYLVARNTWDETLTYRLNFAVWRLRVFLSLIATYFLWLTLLPQGKSFANYDQAEMLTYIVGGSIVYSIVLSTRVPAVTDDIVQGDLSNYLLKPLNYISYYFFKDIGDKGMNIVFSLFEVTIIFILLRPPFIFQTNPTYMIAFVVAILLAICINFFLNMMLSFIGFFSAEAWAPRFIFYILLSFFSGTIFPLDILPPPVYFILNLLPFPYLIYIPMKIYLGQQEAHQIILELLLGGGWVIILLVVIRLLWKKGIRFYSAQGR